MICFWMIKFSFLFSDSAYAYDDADTSSDSDDDEVIKRYQVSLANQAPVGGTNFKKAPSNQSIKSNKSTKSSKSTKSNKSTKSTKSNAESLKTSQNGSCKYNHFNKNFSFFFFSFFHCWTLQYDFGFTQRIWMERIALKSSPML